MILLIASYLVITEIDYLIARRYFGDRVRLLGHWSELNVELLSPADVVVVYEGDIDEGVVPADIPDSVADHGAGALLLEGSLRMQSRTLYFGDRKGVFRTTSIQSCHEVCRMIVATANRVNWNRPAPIAI